MSAMRVPGSGGRGPDYDEDPNSKVINRDVRQKKLDELRTTEWYRAIKHSDPSKQVVFKPNGINEKKETLAVLIDRGTFTEPSYFNLRALSFRPDEDGRYANDWYIISES